LQETDQLPDPGRATVAPDRRVIDAVELQELLRLRVLAGGDLHLVARVAQAGDDGPEHEDMRRRADVHPHSHSDAMRLRLTVGCTCASRAPAQDRTRPRGSARAAPPS